MQESKSQEVILKFYLPEHKEELEMTMNALNYYCAIEEVRNHIRSRLKYEDGLSEEVAEALERVRTVLNESLEN